MLPAATMYERDDFPPAFQTLQPTPFRQVTDAVVAPADIVVYRDGRVHLRHDEIAAEVAKLSRRSIPAGYPFRLIRMRELRSENTWTHNAPLLMRGKRRQCAVMHVDDAAAQGIVDGDTVRVSSPYGTIELPMRLTCDIMAGVVATPHGWGHRGAGGWRLANRAAGVNVNRLTSSGPDDLEQLAGMARLIGVPVRVESARRPSATRLAAPNAPNTA